MPVAQNPPPNAACEGLHQQQRQRMFGVGRDDLVSKQVFRHWKQVLSFGRVAAGKSLLRQFDRPTAVSISI